MMPPHAESLQGIRLKMVMQHAELNGLVLTKGQPGFLAPTYMLLQDHSQQHSSQLSKPSSDTDAPESRQIDASGEPQRWTLVDGISLFMGKLGPMKEVVKRYPQITSASGVPVQLLLDGMGMAAGLPQITMLTYALAGRRRGPTATPGLESFI